MHNLGHPSLIKMEKCWKSFKDIVEELEIKILNNSAVLIHLTPEEKGKISCILKFGYFRWLSPVSYQFELGS